MKLNWRKRTCIWITLLVPPIIAVGLQIYANEDSFFYNKMNTENKEVIEQGLKKIHVKEGKNEELTYDLLISLQKNG